MAKFIITGLKKGDYGTSNPLTESNLTELGNIYMTSSGGGTGTGSEIYPISLNFTSGIFTMGMSGASNLIVNLDGRYSLFAHNHDDRYFTETESDVRFAPFSHTHSILTPGTGISGSTYNGGTAQTFSVAYGTTPGTAAQGNDSRVNNGQTAFTWGDHRLHGLGTNSTNGSSARVQSDGTTAITSFNHFWQGGMHQTDYGMGYTDGPEGYGSKGGVLNIITHATSVGQIFIGRETKKLYFRDGYNGWSAWKEMATTEYVDSVATGGGGGGTYLAGTGLILSGSTFSASFGSGTGTVAQGNDSRINNGQTAFTWGNHASSGYLTSLPAHNHDTFYDKYLNWNLRVNSGSSHPVPTSGIVNLIAGTNMSIAQSGGNITFSSAGDAGGGTYLAGTGLTLTGSTFSANFGSASGTVAEGNDSRIINGQTAFGWGNHASAGYLTSESDPKGLLSVAVTGTTTKTLTLTLNDATTVGTTFTDYNTDTTYSNMLLTELNAGTATTARTISASTLTSWGDGKFAPVSHSHNYDNYNYWSLGANASYTNIGSTAAVNFVGSGASSVSRTGNTITISSTDTNTNTTYSAGTGLSLSSTTFSNTDTGSSQLIFKRIGNSAGTQQFAAVSNNDMIRFNGTGATSVSFSSATNTITISSTDTNTNTTYSAGTGITLSGTTFSVVGGAGITADSGGVSITSGGVGATQLNVVGNGTTSQYLRSDGDGSFTWVTPTDTNTTYSAGNGIGLSGTTFSVLGGTGITADVSGVSITAGGVGATQLNVTGNGTTAQYLRSDGDGSFTWATPTNTDTNYYLSGVSGSGNGTVTFTRNGLANLTWSAAHTHSEYSLTSHGHTYASFGISNTSNTSGNGISLYGGAVSGKPAYGLMFSGTATHGTYGGMSGDWATYFTMTGALERGWVFKHGTTNVASISGHGSAKFASYIQAASFYEESLRKLKTNIEPFTLDGLSLINNLEIVTFDRVDKNVKNKIGVIADDSPKEFLNEELTGVDLYKTIFIQAKAIQELNNKVERLETLVEKLLNNG